MTCVDHTNTATQFSSLTSHTTMRLYTGSRTPPLLILEKYLWQKCISEKVWMTQPHSVVLAFTQPAILKLFSECDFYVSSVSGQWFWLAAPADYGSINTELGALDMINRYRLETARGAQTLLKERHWNYNGVDMDYKMETGVHNGTCKRVHL